MSIGAGVIRGHLITLRRFLLTFWRDIRLGQGLTRRGGGTQLLDFFRGPKRGKEPTVQQDFNTVGLFTVEYPDERLPVYERFRVLPVLIYDTEDGNVRCTSCNICAKVCPPAVHLDEPGQEPQGDRRAAAGRFLYRHGRLHELRSVLGVLPVRRDQDGPQLRALELRAAPDAHFQLAGSAGFERVLRQDPPEAWNSADEVTERNKVAKKKDQRLQKAPGGHQARRGQARPCPSP